MAPIGTESTQTRHTFVATVEEVDEADRILRRLDRIDALDREHAPPCLVIDELRALVGEAEAWARIEGDVRACSAVAKLREEAEGMR